jgi:ribonuclease D
MSQDQLTSPTTTDQKMHPITSMDDLTAFCEKISSAEYIAVDTEFVRDKTYYPKLCLIQIASPDVIACIDPIALKDLSPLKPIFTNPEQIKVFHAARQDLEILFSELKAMPHPVFDTQIAATLLGLGEQIGYGNLVKSFLNIDLSKQHARADWEQRPLSSEQLEYAADDVRYLIQMYPLILNKLDKYGRRDWLQRDFDILTDPALYQVDISELWQRVSGNQKLRRKQLAVLQELCIWREQTAMQKDKPRKWILADNHLIAIATQTPTSVHKLGKIRGLNTNIIERHGEAIINAVQTALAKPEENWPAPQKRKQLNKNQEATIDALMAIAKLKAMQHSINIGAILNRSELEKLILGEKELSIQTGWRYNLVGESLMNFLENKLSLEYNNSELKITNTLK